MTSAFFASSIFCLDKITKKSPKPANKYAISFITVAKNSVCINYLSDDF